MTKNARRWLLAGIFLCCPVAWGHDTWLETDTALVRVGDLVHIDLKLGNHGNHHRDFKLASKVTADWCTLDALTPSGAKYDLKGKLIDLGFTAKEGYWSAPLTAAEGGIYTIVQTMDRVVNHGKPVRAVRCAKTFVLAAPSLDRPTPPGGRPFAKSLDLPLELVLDSCPVTESSPGQPIAARLLRRGQPVAGEVVSFIPRGAVLREGFDDRYERKTDAAGRASFSPAEGNVVLIVAHLATDENGKDHVATHYAASLTVRVPQLPRLAK